MCTAYASSRSFASLLKWCHTCFFKAFWCRWTTEEDRVKKVFGLQWVSWFLQWVGGFLQVLQILLEIILPTPHLSQQPRVIFSTLANTASPGARADARSLCPVQQHQCGELLHQSIWEGSPLQSSQSDFYFHFQIFTFTFTSSIQNIHFFFMFYISEEGHVI